MIGLLFGWALRGELAMEWRLFLAVGLLGGFTTFSAFSMETISLLRDGHSGYATAYILASVGLGLCATLLGIWIVKS
jgi:fluoride exporter